ncbi:hypothetical protein JCM2811A_29730 [Methylorubrum rhodinum]
MVKLAPTGIHIMRRLALSALATGLVSGLLPAFLVAGSGSALALSLPFEESTYRPPEATTTYVERSLNRQAPLTIEHLPVERNPRGRRGDSAAIAGFCRDGGTILRRDDSGRPVYLRQREVCDNVAPRQMWPGHVDPRPAWPAERARMRSRAIVTKY